MYVLVEFWETESKENKEKINRISKNCGTSTICIKGILEERVKGPKKYLK